MKLCFFCENLTKKMKHRSQYSFTVQGITMKSIKESKKIVSLHSCFQVFYSKSSSTFSAKKHGKSEKKSGIFNLQNFLLESKTCKNYPESNSLIQYENYVKNLS